jgi:hypothetical protein
LKLVAQAQASSYLVVAGAALYLSRSTSARSSDPKTPPMSALFRRHSNVQCFFCNSTIPIPQNPRNFRCSACGCWNRYNEKGEILSDDPAMHQEHLNRKSFAKRGMCVIYNPAPRQALNLYLASPSKDQLPNLPRPGKFCHNCQTNQMLIMNLLSNYLPAPEVRFRFLLYYPPRSSRVSRVQNMPIESRCSQNTKSRYILATHPCANRVSPQ